MTSKFAKNGLVSVSKSGVRPTNYLKLAASFNLAHPVVCYSEDVQYVQDGAYENRASTSKLLVTDRQTRRQTRLNTMHTVAD